MRTSGKGKDWYMHASNPRTVTVSLPVKVWSAIHLSWRSELVKQNGTLNPQWYTRFLRNSMLPLTTHVLGWNIVYVQDNTTHHTAHDMTAFLAYQDVEIMDHQAQNLDMNPVEHVWEQMGSEYQMWMTPFHNVPELRCVVLQAWAAVHPRRVSTRVRACRAGCIVYIMY